MENLSGGYSHYDDVLFVHTLGFWVGEYTTGLTFANKASLTALYLPYLIIPLLMVAKYSVRISTRQQISKRYLYVCVYMY